MPKLAKRIKENTGKFEKLRRYTLQEGIELLKTMKTVKFDETVELAIRLGVDPAKSDQMVRGVVKLPHGTGRQVKVLVFAKGEFADQAREAGADYVGDEDLVAKIKEGWLDFDKAIATPDMMPKVGPIAKILGPRGLMPNPKVGTVTRDVGQAVQDQKAGSIEFRVEKKGAIVHAAVGKMSFDSNKIQENTVALLEQIIRQKPSTAKGTYLQGITLTSTMGPGIRIDTANAQSLAKI